MLRVIVIAFLVILAACTVAVIAVVLHAGKYDRQVEELQAEREQPQPDQEPAAYEPVYYEDKTCCGLLEEDEP
ncbi:MAG: hypothetical protein IJR36_06930 [Lachnospiraceae bacterium]|nr:hypothetical protein [Lachnospiraceae bacterium]